MSAYSSFFVMGSCELSRADASVSLELSRRMSRWSWISGGLWDWVMGSIGRKRRNAPVNDNDKTDEPPQRTLDQQRNIENTPFLSSHPAFDDLP